MVGSVVHRILLAYRGGAKLNEHRRRRISKWTVNGAGLAVGALIDLASDREGREVCSDGFACSQGL